jgi:uncharacterized protein YcfJ
MNATIKAALGVIGLVLAMQAAAQITFYENPGFGGRSFTADRPIPNFDPLGFNDRASSAVVTSGEWEVCEHAGFGGQCTVLRPGRYDSLAPMGMNNAVSSVRPVGRAARAVEPPPPVIASNNYRRRNGERLFEAEVTSVRAVVGPPEQRCWIEREQVQERGGPNVPGAIAGAVIGGIIGHQIGGGRGRDVATVGGAVGGAAVGANVGRGGGGYGQDVQRCRDVSSRHPEFWDVTYNFRGQEHRVQMSTPPGRTIMVNRDGEPRV